MSAVLYCCFVTVQLLVQWWRLRMNGARHLIVIKVINVLTAILVWNCSSILM